MIYKLMKFVFTLEEEKPLNHISNLNHLCCECSSVCFDLQKLMQAKQRSSNYNELCEFMYSYTEAH